MYCENWTAALERSLTLLVMSLYNSKGGNDEWKLFHAFKNDMRKKVIPTLKKSKVRYDTYSPWFKDLKTHCIIHTGFYPEEYTTYLSHCFLIYTDYQESVNLLFSFLPTSSSILEVGNCLLVFTSPFSSNINRSLFCALYDMKSKDIIKKFYHAITLNTFAIKNLLHCVFVSGEHSYSFDTL
jgi:hypothetical protein